MLTKQKKIWQKNGVKALLITLFFITLAELRADEGQGPLDLAVPESVGGIHVHGLGAYSGKNLSAFYVSGRPPAVGTSGMVLNVNRVIAGPVTVQISGSGEAVIPSLNVPDSDAVLNNVLLMVHEQNEIFIRNANGKCADDERLAKQPCAQLAESSFNYFKMKALGLDPRTESAAKDVAF